MIRFFFLALLNFSLPFLLRAAWVLWRRWRLQEGKTVPNWRQEFNVIRLLLWGLLLLFITLAGSRLLVEPDTSFVGNVVRSVDY